jgi:endo-1,4-beta-xylanase
VKRAPRLVLAGVAVALAVGGTVTQATGATTHPGVAAAPDTSLKVLAAQAGLRIGTAVNTDVLATDPAYAQITADQFSTVTPENVMKWDTIEPTQGQYNWGPADGLVNFARAHGQKVRGHTLVWYNQIPSWITNGNFTNDQLKALLHKHITDEVTHFKGNIWQWDVVNEAFNDDGTLRDTIWLRAIGPDYIADAFRWAHEADPKALLFYNDYNIEGLGAKSDAVYTLLAQLKHEGVPIDGVGLQGHLDTQYGLPEDMTGNLDRFARLHLYSAFTEADARTTLPATSAELLAEGTDYNAMLQSCLQVSRCISYTVWGWSDKWSWVPGVFAGEGSADLYDENYVPKEAYAAVHQTLALAGGAPARFRS